MRALIGNQHSNTASLKAQSKHFSEITLELQSRLMILSKFQVIS